MIDCSEEGDDDDDDELELMAELQRIKAEKAAAQLKLEQEEKAAAEQNKINSAMLSNPLLNNANADSKVRHLDKPTNCQHII